MLKKRDGFALLAFVIVLQTITEIHGRKKKPANQKIENLVTSVDYFTSSLYKNLTTGINENIFVSPFSVATILSMVYLGARKDSAKQLKNVLKLSSTPDSVALAFKEYLSILKKPDEFVTFNLANHLYADNKFPILENYTNMISKYFFSAIENVDFVENAERIRVDINKWVKKKTNNKITDLLTSGSLSPQTMLLLINAVYFKGRWAKKFPDAATSSRKFHLSSDKAVSHDFMYISKDFNTKIYKKYKVVELPYKGKTFSMFVIVPNKINGLAALEKEIDTQFLKEIKERKGFNQLFLELHLPKFHLQSSFQLSDTLQNLGLSDIFNANKANLSGISDSPRNLYADTFFHKTFLDVAEKRTKAAAASGIKISPVSAEFGTSFDVNHPFIFLIVDNRVKMIHFIGKVTNPTE